MQVGGLVGTVHELGLFATTIITPDNVFTLVGNSKIFGDTIQNFSARPVRRVERTAQLAGSVDALDAIARFKAAVAQIPNVCHDPAPEVNLLDINLVGTVIAVRPYCHTDHYWQVYFDTNEAIVRVLQGSRLAGADAVATHQDDGRLSQRGRRAHSALAGAGVQASDSTPNSPASSSR